VNLWYDAKTQFPKLTATCCGLLLTAAEICKLQRSDFLTDRVHKHKQIQSSTLNIDSNVVCVAVCCLMKCDKQGFMTLIVQLKNTSCRKRQQNDASCSGLIGNRPKCAQNTRLQSSTHKKSKQRGVCCCCLALRCCDRQNDAAGVGKLQWPDK
jgi:hypothetical protein